MDVVVKDLHEDRDAMLLEYWRLFSKCTTTNDDFCTKA